MYSVSFCLVTKCALESLAMRLNDSVYPPLKFSVTNASYFSFSKPLSFSFRLIFLTFCKEKLLYDENNRKNGRVSLLHVDVIPIMIDLLIRADSFEWEKMNILYPS